ncbi:DUF2065 domain-containing protein [Salinimonas chungwhensis]|uniref:DUF2065 domain-containing protein n=1 Tax=Salinimonas chungwhensis TaxID=265425 RepID=UPI000A03D094|nr:DUF2065 domain-containing protein [Salinimonas chungwhensis]
MSSSWESCLGLAIALVLILEGLGPLLFPNRWQRVMRKLSESPGSALRQTGALLVISGVILVIILNP